MGENGGKQGETAWATKVEFKPHALPLGALVPPRPPLVHLWYLDLGGLWHTLSAALGDSDAAGDAAADLSMAQLRFARRFYLRMMLGAYLGIAGKDVSLVRGPRGKPILDASRHGDDLHFSLSKSGRRVLIGIAAGQEIGVDLELRHRRPRDVRDLARRFFTDAEAQTLCSLDAEERDAAFMRTWACKEAVAKASGHGIANRFCRFAVSAGSESQPSVTSDEDHPVEDWRLVLLTPEDACIAAVAVRHPELRIEAFRI